MDATLPQIKTHAKFRAAFCVLTVSQGRSSMGSGVSVAPAPTRAGAFRTVRGRMLCWILAVTVPIYAGALYMSYQTTAGHLEAGAERDADELAGRLAAGLDAVIRPIEGGIRTVAYQLEEVDPPRTEYAQRIR